jgi:multidrug resistance efflux pump
VIAQATLDTYTRNLETAKQSLVGARAEEERARLAHSSNIDGVNTTVARLQAELADAQWDLDRDAGARGLAAVELRLAQN